MADRSLAIRLAVIDGGKVKAELRDVGDAGSRSLKRIEDAARPASRALQALDGVAGEVRGNLESMAGRLGPLGAGLVRLGPAGIAAAGAIAGVGLALTRSFQEAAEADRSYRRLEAVLKATGHASGLTAGEIGVFAEAMEASTLVTAEAVQDAASVLATFRSVSGDTFTRALSLAQDLATVFGQDLSATATQLGKALEDPTQGLTALRRVGISFTESERELITSLAETGRTAEAQRLILDALEKQVGGAGAAEAGGLTGATNRLGDAWGNLLEAIGRTPVIASVAHGALNILSSAIEGITGAIEDDPIDARIDAAKNRLLRAKEDLARIEAGAAGTPLLGQRFATEEQRQRVAALEAEVAKLEQIAKAESDAEAAAKARAEAGRKAAEVERLREALTGQRRDLDKALDQLANTPSERIALVNRELAETEKRLQALKAPDGSNIGEIDAALKQAEEIARRKIAQINQPAVDQAQRAREEAARKAAAEQAAAERAYQSNAKVIDDLARQLATFGNERQQFIDQAMERLSAGATDAQRQEVERLANALLDEKRAYEESAEALRKKEQLRQEGTRLIAETRTPAEQLAATVAHLNELQKAGAIDAETHGRALSQAYAEMDRSAQDALATSREWQDGMSRALQEYAARATDAAANAEQVTTQAFAHMEDALVAFVQTGKMDFKGLADSIIADITRIAIRQAIIGPLAGALFGGGAAAGGAGMLGGLFGGGAGAGTAAGADAAAAGAPYALVWHQGGVVGHDTAPQRAVDPVLFLNAPRYHAGGRVGLGPNEVPAILERGETVIPKGRRPQSSSSGVTVYMTVNARDADSFRKSESQLTGELAARLARAKHRNT
ncbi:MAG TPA: phage tail tape measure C-terminal domain-containing protein [Defluviicoccus sp.]|nr:phage tail tape measure C-terminal domain-containing protein [Defluviicoccus sp.]